MKNIMKKFSKRFIATFLLIILSTINISSVGYAKSTKEVSYLNSNQRKLLEEVNIDLDTVEILDKNLIFSYEQLKKMELEDDQILTNQGLKKDCEIYYIEKSSMSSDNYAIRSTTTNSYDMLLHVVRQYTSVDQKATGVSGMGSLLDVVWNIYIGSSTRFFWKAATILGLNPSMFFANYMSGDSLVATERQIYNDNVYCYFDENYTYWPLVRVSRLELNVYNDFYSVDIYGNDIRDSGMTTFGAYTAHYFNDTWINNECAANRLYNGMVTTYDYFN